MQETAYKLMVLQRENLVVYEAGTHNSQEWKNKMRHFDYKDLYFIYEVVSLYYDHVYKLKLKLGITIKPQPMDL